MREIYHPVKIANYMDIEECVRGIIKESQIHKVELNARIDTGATHVSISGEIAKHQSRIT